MSELMQILVIAVAQGIGEFFPVSSSGHNAVINHFFYRFGNELAQNSAEFAKLNILLHLGTLLAIMFVFRKRIAALFGNERRLIPMLVIATMPLAVIGLPMILLFPGIHICLPLISVCFTLTGMMLLFASRLPNGEKTTKSMTWKDALFIGIAQAFALFPGISRLGITLVAGMCCRLDREESATFSFLLSIPTILIIGIWQCAVLVQEPPMPNAMPTWLLLLGALTSCLVGIVALLLFLVWLKRGQLWHFAVWVFMMSLIALLLAI